MLVRSTDVPFVVLTAPAGYGKTMLLAEWAAVDARPFAWITVDDADNDPLQLIAGIASALERFPDLERVHLGDPGGERIADALPALERSLTSAPDPFVLVLDGGCDLDSEQSASLMERLVSLLPAGSQLALSGRQPPPVALPRMRAAGALLELGIRQLALDTAQVRELMRKEGVEPAEVDLEDVMARTEGWPVGVCLAALAFRKRISKNGRAARWSGGRDRNVVDYLRAEDLSRVSSEDWDFLVRTSVLDRLSGPLCDAVLGKADSARRLSDLEQRNHFVIPLDDRREWYRYHRLYRETLRAELELAESGAPAALCRSALDWYEERGELESALDYAVAADDRDALARLAGRAALPAYQLGRTPAVERWLDEFDEERALKQNPAIAIVGAWVHAFAGRSEQAGRWARVVERSTPHGPMPDGTAEPGPWLALLRAAMCRRGLDALGVDAETAVGGLASFSPWRPAALLMRGVAALFDGDGERADAALADAVEVARAQDAADVLSMALAERAVCALDGGDPARGCRFADDARSTVERFGLEGRATTALVLAVGARCSAARSDPSAARADLEQARALRPLLTHAAPWLAIQTRLQLASAHLAVAAPGESRALLREIRDVLQRAPNMGRLAAATDELRMRVERIVEGGDGGWVSTLSTAELRLLPQLAAPWTFMEIADRLCLSRYTVKTEAISIYRKLGVSSRSAALRRAAELGLLDPAAGVAPCGRSGCLIGHPQVASDFAVR
jgi:LuxR family maltose regulon positive regulatory protein